MDKRKFGEDRSINNVTILSTDAGRTLDMQVILYSVQCYVLHWTDRTTVNGFLQYMIHLPLRAKLTWVVGYISRWFTCTHTVTHPSSNHFIVTGSEVKPTTP